MQLSVLSPGARAEPRLVGVLALSAQPVVEALSGAACLGSMLVTMETAQPGMEPFLSSRPHEGEGPGEDAVEDGVS